MYCLNAPRVIIPFSCCIPVLGYKQSIIYDLNRQKYYIIPNDLVHILLRIINNNLSKQNIYEDYSEDEKETLDEYFDFLEKNEFIFYGDRFEKKLFLALSKKWDHPAEITNAIIDRSSFSQYSVKKLILQLDNLGCEHIQIRICDTYKYIDDLEKILDNINGSCALSVDLYIPYIPAISEANICRIAHKHLRIKNIFIYGAQMFSMRSIKNRPWGNIINVKHPLNIDKPIQDPNYFTIDVKLYTESLNFNNYFNRKVYIDSSGNIKIAPEVNEIFGNMDNMDLSNVTRGAFRKIRKKLLTIN